MDTDEPHGGGHLRSRLGVAGGHSAAIDALFADCDRPGQPGVNLCVVRGGDVVHRRGYGVANVEEDSPFTAETVLHLGSTTKHLCACCVLILEDRGLLTLEDPITRWVEGLPAFFGAISLRHLLTMTSGLPDGLNASLFSGGTSAGISQAAHLALLRRLPAPMFAPGAGTTYSNSNYLLVSKALERAAGAPLADLMDREIFAPLGMADTALHPDPSVAAPRRARGYAIDGQGRARTQASMLELCGDGAVVTTLEDMARWAAAYRTGRLARDFRARLEAEARLCDGAATGYGLGIGLTSVGGRAKISHGGGMPGYLADFAYVPHEDLFVIWLANRMDPGLFDRTDRIIEAVLGAAERPASSLAPVRPLAGLSGVWVERSLGCTAEFEIGDDGPVLHVMGERLIPEPTGPGAYRPSKASAYYPFRVTDRVRAGRPVIEMKLALAEWSEMTPWVEDDAEGVAPADYAGAYRSDLFGETHYVRAADGGLEVTLGSPSRALLWRALKPRGGGLFSAVIPGEPSDTDVSLLFHRGPDGRVERFEYNLARNRAVAFVRLADGAW